MNILAGDSDKAKVTSEWKQPISVIGQHLWRHVATNRCPVHKVLGTFPNPTGSRPAAFPRGRPRGSVRDMPPHAQDTPGGSLSPCGTAAEPSATGVSTAASRRHRCLPPRGPPRGAGSASRPTGGWHPSEIAHRSRPRRSHAARPTARQAFFPRPHGRSPPLDRSPQPEAPDSEGSHCPPASDSCSDNRPRHRHGRETGAASCARSPARGDGRNRGPDPA